jgi:DHA1 family inner membrane transport protein
MPALRSRSARSRPAVPPVLALLALAIGAFGIGTTEFIVSGLLPQIAGTYHATVPTAGLLVTGYALGVMAGAPLLTALSTRVPRKRMLQLLMLLFIAGNLLSAAAPAFGAMLAGRLVASLAHGAFFGIGSVLAADLVAPAKRASAIALMFTGLTVANVLGVPLGTTLGQHLGWRAAFLGIAGIGVLAVAGVTALVPGASSESQHSGESRSLRSELTAFRNPQVLLAMGMTVFGFGGVFAAITYITPILTGVAGYADSSVSWLLVLFGLGMVAGNLIGGRFADRALLPMLFTALTGLAVTLALFTATSHSEALSAVTVVLLGLFGFATVPPLQKRVLDQARQAPTLASAANVGAFNLGNALAAWLGGLVISGGLGLTAPAWVGASMTGLAILLAILAARLERRANLSPTPPLPESRAAAPVPAVMAQRAE